MGMAVYEKPPTRNELLAKQYRLYHCKSCDGAYPKDAKFVKGFWHEGTAADWTTIAKVPQEFCPICYSPKTVSE